MSNYRPGWVRWVALVLVFALVAGVLISTAFLIVA